MTRPASAENDASVLTLGWYCLSIIVSVGFGIAGSVIAAANSEAKGECGPGVWYALLFMSILHLMGTVSLCCRITDFLQGKSHTRGTADIYWSMVNIGMMIWCYVAYYNVSDDCAKFYDAKFPDLRKMLFANVVLNSVLFSLLALVFVLACLGLMAGNTIPAADFESSRTPRFPAAIPTHPNPAASYQSHLNTHLNSQAKFQPSAPPLDSVVTEA